MRHNCPQFFGALLLALVLAGCTTQSYSAPHVSEATLKKQVQGTNAFAFDLYQALRNEHKNLFYSPYSISLALAMTYAGARGETEEQIADTLHFVLPQDRLHSAFSALNRALEPGEEEEAEADGTEPTPVPFPGYHPGDRFQLHVANALWGQDGYQFQPEFLAVLGQNYESELRTLSFAGAPEESRRTINDWVADHTEDRIRDILPQGAIRDATRLVLANAIYFRASWFYPFDPRATREQPFHLLDGGTATVPMMQQTERFNYYLGEGYQAVMLPYSGGKDSPHSRMSMVFLVPDAGRFQAFEDSLDAQGVGTILTEMNTGYVDLTIPKFGFDSAFALKPTLSSMGMSLAFSWPKADFSGMTGQPELFVDDVHHRAFVSVEETGTEAAAASAVPITLGIPPEPVEITIDRPFIFLIRDGETGIILFVGRVLDPSP
jgi:serpin B